MKYELVKLTVVVNQLKGNDCRKCKQLMIMQMIMRVIVKLIIIMIAVILVIKTAIIKKLMHK